MIASRVTPPAEEEGADVDGVKEAGGVVVSVCGHFGRSWALLRLTVAASMAHMTEKWSETGKEKEKWQRILMIDEGKMSLS